MEQSGTPRSPLKAGEKFWGVPVAATPTAQPTSGPVPTWHDCGGPTGLTGAPPPSCSSRPPLLSSAWSRLLFTAVTPLVASANTNGQLRAHEADPLLPDSYAAARLAGRFATVIAWRTWPAPSCAACKTSCLLRTLAYIYTLPVLWQVVGGLALMGLRIAQALLLRVFLTWLRAATASSQAAPAASQSSASASPSHNAGWLGWLLALGLGLLTFVICTVQHQWSFAGNELGLKAQQSVIAAIHDKALRLSAPAVAQFGRGYVLNLVSNDARRINDGLTNGLNAVLGPVELLVVFALLAVALGPLPALAGSACLLAIIPMQLALVRPIAKISAAYADATDTRMQLLLEALNSCLTMKVLGLEARLTDSLQHLRRVEEVQVARIAAIRTVNMTLQFAMAGLTAFTMFVCYRFMYGTLDYPVVFYALALLALPLRSMFVFVTAIQVLTEAAISVRRIDAFLCTYEPPLPLTSTPRSQLCVVGVPAATVQDKAQAARKRDPWRRVWRNATAAGLSDSKSSLHSSSHDSCSNGSHCQGEAEGLQRGPAEIGASLVLRGADYDWRCPMGLPAVEQQGQEAPSATQMDAVVWVQDVGAAPALSSAGRLGDESPGSAPLDAAPCACPSAGRPTIDVHLRLPSADPAVAERGQVPASSTAHVAPFGLPVLPAALGPQTLRHLGLAPPAAARQPSWSAVRRSASSYSHSPEPPALQVAARHASVAHITLLACPLNSLDIVLFDDEQCDGKADACSPQPPQCAAHWRRQLLRPDRSMYRGLQGGQALEPSMYGWAGGTSRRGELALGQDVEEAEEEEDGGEGHDHGVLLAPRPIDRPRAANTASAAGGAAGGAAQELVPAADGQTVAPEQVAIECEISGCTLRGVELCVCPGELLGITGEVGSGKSSLLAALLGELQPLAPASPAREEAPQGGRATPPAGAGQAGGCEARCEGTEASSPSEAATPVKLLSMAQLSYDSPTKQQQQQQQQQAGVALRYGPALVALPSSGSIMMGAAGAALVEPSLYTTQDRGGHLQGMRQGSSDRPSVAYCPQVPYLVAGSLRDNVLFGRAFDEVRYRAVLEACCLEQEVALMPRGDHTLVGERGANLSGGQRARVALARAAYSGAAIQLLDDPFSVLDPRVCELLFSRVFGGAKGTQPSSQHDGAGHAAPPLPASDSELETASSEVPSSADKTSPACHPASPFAGVSVTALGPAAPTRPALMAGSTRLLVTHQRHLLPRCDRVLVLRAGRVVALGTWQELAPLDLPELRGAEGGAQPPALISHRSGAPSPQKSAVSSHASKRALHIRAHASEGARSSMDKHGSSGNAGVGGRKSDDGCRGRQGSSVDGTAPAPSVHKASACAGGQAGKKAAGGSAAATAQEGKRVGGVGWPVYAAVASHAGWSYLAVTAAALLLGQGASVAADWWLALWSKAPADNQARMEWVWVYGLLVGLMLVFGAMRAAAFYTGLVRAATAIHDLMVLHVLRSSLAFFHANPTGRILNRFCKDQTMLDVQLPLGLFEALQLGIQLLGALVLVSVAVPMILPVFVPLAIISGYIYKRYVAAGREVKRWESVVRSPVYTHLSATLRGLPTIRAFGAEAVFQSQFLQLLNSNTAWLYAMILAPRWVGLRLDYVASTIVLAASLLSVAMKDWVQPALVALALTQVISMTGVIQRFTRQMAEVENNMTSVERMLEYACLPFEAPTVAEGGGQAPAGPSAEPQAGASAQVPALAFEDVTAAYQPGLQPVLSNLTFKLAPGTRCGLVGRTGSGKSSLLLALFRLIELRAGRVLLSGVDISSLGIDVLRRQLAIIPQDPVLFSGTIRSNLDPWGRYSDAALWEVLSAVQLKAVVAAAGGLLAPMHNGGENLSCGQRQLFSLARALLQDASVLALDEATANVDAGMDRVIQEALRKALTAEAPQPMNLPASSTTSLAVGPSRKRLLIMIAHRLDTIMDMDTLLVLKAGRLVEQGLPQELLRKENAVFATMAAAARSRLQKA